MCQFDRSGRARLNSQRRAQRAHFWVSQASDALACVRRTALRFWRRGQRQILATFSVQKHACRKHTVCALVAAHQENSDDTSTSVGLGVRRRMESWAEANHLANVRARLWCVTLYTLYTPSSAMCNLISRNFVLSSACEPMDSVWSAGGFVNLSQITRRTGDAKKFPAWGDERIFVYYTRELQRLRFVEMHFNLVVN